MKLFVNISILCKFQDEKLIKFFFLDHQLKLENTVKYPNTVDCQLLGRNFDSRILIFNTRFKINLKCHCSINKILEALQLVFRNI
jgi:hypothetical protein